LKAQIGLTSETSPSEDVRQSKYRRQRSSQTNEKGTNPQERPRTRDQHAGLSVKNAIKNKLSKHACKEKKKCIVTPSEGGRETVVSRRREGRKRRKKRKNKKVPTPAVAFHERPIGTETATKRNQAATVRKTIGGGKGKPETEACRRSEGTREG